MSPSLRRRVPAGLLDSGSASLGSFVAGLVATWLLSPGELGVYAVFFSAFVVGAYLPRNLIFMPSEIVSIDLPEAQRSRLILQSFRLALLPAAGGTLAIGIAAAASMNLAEPDFLIPLAITAGITTFVSPFQDHVRRILHLADRSWNAATVSIILLVTTVVTVVVFPLGIVDADLLGHGWIPFGILLIANIVSLVAGVVIAMRSPAAPREIITMRRLLRHGGWLTASAFYTKGAAFLAATIISNLVGPDVLGYAEAARIAAQPLMVLGFGLDDVFAPRFMDVGRRGDAASASSYERTYLMLTFGLGAVYLFVAGFDWVLNPMAHLVPLAYAVPGLTAVSIAANLAMNATYPYRGQLMGAHQERAIARTDAASSVAPILVAFSAPLTLSFSKPLSVIAQTVHQVWSYRIKTTARYEAAEEPAMAVGGAP